MKVYLCWKPDELRECDEQLLGVFLHEKDAQNMKQACDTAETQCVVEPWGLIE